MWERWAFRSCSFKNTEKLAPPNQVKFRLAVGAAAAHGVDDCSNPKLDSGKQFAFVYWICWSECAALSSVATAHRVTICMCNITCVLRFVCHFRLTVAYSAESHRDFNLWLVYSDDDDDDDTTRAGSVVESSAAPKIHWNSRTRTSTLERFTDNTLRPHFGKELYSISPQQSPKPHHSATPISSPLYRLNQWQFLIVLPFILITHYMDWT